MFKIKRYCKFCGEKLDLSLKNHYVAEKSEKNTLFADTKTYDAVDCIYCGRQCIMGERLRMKHSEANYDK
ncbi:MAG: hypothetical protein JNG49_08465 [Peptostreptococcus stomatis]|uniref:hypothetical protein n=1 Tax=Peptostreptococcus stomatis TaxID=341694 RepID=UPI001A45FFD1|nr:hypothetical protein [Peptostreptococcus stomatis]MBL6466432.1 hypothetical protein [Peptostreptococcus stomatis]